MSKHSNLELLLLLAEVYELQKKDREAYKIYEHIYTLYPGHPEIYAKSLQYKLILEGHDAGEEFTNKQLELHNSSVIAGFYHIHFLMSSANQENENVSALLAQLRKKYFWHPDFALIKAFLTPNKTSKILKRRCDDYPGCALSKSYFEYFTNGKHKTRQLNNQEKRHFEIVRMIYAYKSSPLP